MAKLSNQKFAAFNADVWGHKTCVRVGHNRELHRRTTNFGDMQLVFKLHGHPVAKLTVIEHDTEPGACTTVLELDACGWLSTTTRAAMHDAIRLFGLWGNVSFAGGRFTAGVEERYTGEALEWSEATGNGGNRWIKTWDGLVGVARTHVPTSAGEERTA